MLVTMNNSKQILVLLIIILFGLQLTACGAASPVPIVIATTRPSFTPITPSIHRTITPSLTPTLTPTLIPTVTFTPTPDFCNSALLQEKIQIVSQSVFTAIGPGPIVHDRILNEQNPAWADFRQYNHGEIRSAGVIFHEIAFGPPSPELGEGVSPAVLLVTYGVDKNWKLPANGDLASEVDYIRAVLRQRERYWILGTIDQSQYPMIANAATYALYHYFGSDLSKLEAWCNTYVQVYGESPLK